VRSNSTPRRLCGFALLLVAVGINGCLIDPNDYPLESSLHDRSDAGAGGLEGGPVANGESGATGESSDAGSGGVRQGGDIGQGGDDSTITGGSGANTATGGASLTDATAGTMSSGGVGNARGHERGRRGCWR
jgi:hypothetical protein